MSLPVLLRSIADLIEEEKRNEAQEDRYSGENVGFGPEEVVLPTQKPIFDDDGKQIGDYEEDGTVQPASSTYPYKPWTIPGIVLKEMRNDSFAEYSYDSLEAKTEIPKRTLMQSMTILKRDGWISRYGIGDKATFTLAKHG